MKKMTQKVYFLMAIVTVFACCLSACHQKKNDNTLNKSTIITATKKRPVEQLFFSGSLSPIQSVAVESSVAGIVDRIGFIYGEHVKKNQTLFVLTSHALAKNYRASITDFLQKKQSYETQLTNYTAEKELFKFGVVSKNEYTSAQSQFENASLSYLESRYALEKVLNIAGITDFSNVESLTLSDTAQLKAILQRHFHNLIVRAPTSGVALYPQQTANAGGGESSGKLSVGSLIKEGQLLISIGDLSGLSATFNVSEVDVNKVKKGMSVIVTGSAFPGMTLHGKVSAVSAQANQGDGNGSGISMFTVNVVIPSVTAAEASIIRVGMTAKFEIDIRGTPQVMLPVAAVSQHAGQNVVQVQLPDGKTKMVPVITGQTTPTDIVIISGVNVGDKVIVPKNEV